MGCKANERERVDAMSEEWGPWIEHDAGPHPQKAKPGDIVISILSSGKSYGPFITDCGKLRPWHSVIRYRIRKPKGLQMLESILRDLPVAKYEDFNA